IVDITERKQLEMELQRLATTDPLTGAANRRSFIQQAQAEIARARRYATPLALLMLDIDHFKQINDSLGHAAGDEAIREVFHCCARLVRVQDMVGRLGGEEFAILLPQTDRAAAQALAERLREQLAGIALHKDGQPVRGLTASFGVAVLLAQDLSIDGMLGRADEALYRAKNRGRNCVEVSAGSADREDDLDVVGEVPANIIPATGSSPSTPNVANSAVSASRPAPN
ncbi:MAG: GGDEF domain-containing protein, partial [Burkholderiaceae bacterium]